MKNDDVIFRVRVDNIGLEYSPSGAWTVREFWQTEKREYSEAYYYPYLDMALKKIVDLKASRTSDFGEMLELLRGIDSKLKSVHVLTPRMAVKSILG